MNVNAQMQTQSKVGSKADSATASVHQQKASKEMLAANPELAKLLEGSPKGMDFAQILEHSQGDGKKGKTGKLSDLMKGLKDAAGELGQEIKSTGIDGDVKSIIMDNKNPSNFKSAIKGNNNAKQFLPERKSIFNINKDATGANKELQNLSALVQNQKMPKNAGLKNGYKSSEKDSIFAKKLESSVTEASSSTAASMKIGDLMLMSDSGESSMNLSSQGQNQASQLNNQVNQTSAAQNAGKVFDMSQIDSANTEEVIGKIQDYIIQSKASSEPNVQMSFEHKELGMIDLQVSKLDNNQLNIMINSRSQEGAKFFAQNQGELLQTLSQAGVQVADLKLDSSNNTNLSQNGNESSMSGDQREGRQGQANDQRDADSQRREELWKLFEGQQAA